MGYANWWVRRLGLHSQAEQEFWKDSVGRYIIISIIVKQIITDLVAYNNTPLLSHSFCRLEIWADLLWIHCFRVSQKASIKVSARAVV